MTSHGSRKIMCFKMADYRENGGFWNQPKVNYSKETHNLLKEMMQESKLTNFQQRFLEKQLRGGGTLPLACNPTSSAKRREPKPPAKPPKYLNPKNYHSNGVRKREVIEASGAYERPDYNPGPSHWGKNSEKEKEKLANVMAFGTDLPPPSEQKRVPRQYVEPEEVPEIDRFDELQAEIEERREFLNDMETMGQGHKYRTIIETEISQKIREMEVLDKKRTRELEEMIAREEARKSKS